MKHALAHKGRDDVMEMSQLIIMLEQVYVRAGFSLTGQLVIDFSHWQRKI